MTKTASSPDSLISIIGNSYFHPIASLLELLSELPGTISEVKSNDIENGYSASVCILLVAALESFTVRIRACDDAKDERFVPVEYLSEKYSNAPSELWEKVNEVFVIRDSLVHNHLWSLVYTSEHDGSLSLNSSSKNKSSGDKKYSAVVNPTTRKTILLKLNIVPVAVCKKDALTALDTVWTALSFLEEQNRGQCPVTHSRVYFRKEWRYFGEVVNSLCSSVTPI